MKEIPKYITQKRKLTPQEKKRLSYLKDRRNAYGQHDKASRKAIRSRKRKINKTYRKLTKQKLLLTNDTFIDEYADLIDIQIKGVKRKFWKKYPDISLKEHIELQKIARINRTVRKKQVKI
jgi:hypothetical protein